MQNSFMADGNTFTDTERPLVEILVMWYRRSHITRNALPQVEIQIIIDAWKRQNSFADLRHRQVLLDL